MPSPSSSTRGTPGGGAPEPAAVPRYRPLCLLGHGGMGSVEAVAEEMADGTTRVVALKRILRTPGTDASRLEMFLREARLTTLLSHPNVIRSLAYGESLGEVFLAMEYIAGEPLSRLIAVSRERGEPLPLPVIAFILAEACEGLHAAHELRGPDGELVGVVHRDVSPHNVMVGYDGEVKLLDFGVAKIDLVESTARTKTGEVKGKTAYMSPEQAMGESVDRRSDLYSVGAVLFECLAGRKMWGDGTDFDVLRRLALEEPPSLADVAPATPPALLTLYKELIEREPTKRPATAHDVALVLREQTGEGGACADAGTVRATMTRLFDRERKERDATIERALQTGAHPSAPPPGARAGAGESGPVFVTHQGATTMPRRDARVVASAALGTALLCGVAVFALVHRTSGTTETRATETPPDAPARAVAAAPERSHDPAPSGSEATPATATSATEPGTKAPSREPSPATDGHLSLPRGLTQPRSKAPIVRHVAVPRLGAGPSPSPAASAPAAPKPQEPPDVDPTPF